jgi:CTD kinase subunit gamma
LQQKDIFFSWEISEFEKLLTQNDAMSSRVNTPPVSQNGMANNQIGPISTRPGEAGLRLDKRQIEQRIEEDRERHKRLRENIWAIGSGGDTEFQRLWQEVSEFGEDDYIAAEEDAMHRRVAAAYE